MWSYFNNSRFFLDPSTCIYSVSSIVEYRMYRIQLAILHMQSSHSHQNPVLAILNLRFTNLAIIYVLKRSTCLQFFIEIFGCYFQCHSKQGDTHLVQYYWTKIGSNSNFCNTSITWSYTKAFASIAHKKSRWLKDLYVISFTRTTLGNCLCNIRTCWKGKMCTYV